MTADGHNTIDLAAGSARPWRQPRRRGLVGVGLAATCVSFVLLGGAGCDWINGTECGGGCIDAEGICRQLSNDFCGKPGEQCDDCTLGGQVCDKLRGQCRNDYDPGGGETVRPLITERCCVVEDGCVPLDKMCDFDRVCQEVRGGPGCKQIDPPGCNPNIENCHPDPDTCESKCTDGCCTPEGQCLKEPALKDCPPEWCDEENARNRTCESPIDRCERECDGCCTRDAKCIRGRDDEQCGTDGRTCANCTSIGQLCDRDEQRCVPGGGGGGLRICLNTVILRGKPAQIETCKADGNHVEVSAVLYVSDGYAAGREESFEGSGYMREIAGPAIVAPAVVEVGFSRCIDVDPDQGADQLVMDFKELDKESNNSMAEVIFAGCVNAAPNPEKDEYDTEEQKQALIRKKLQQCDDDRRAAGATMGCQKSTELGGCTLDLRGLMSNSIGGATQKIPVDDCDRLVESAR